MEVDGGRAVMARAVVVRLFDEVGIVAASFDDAGVGAVSSVLVRRSLISVNVSISAVVRCSGGKVRLPCDMAADDPQGSRER